MNVGIIGLGAMGLGVARVLLGKGFAVHGCDVRQQALDAFAAAGGQAHQTPAALASKCSVVMVFVVNAQQTLQAMFGEGGAARALPPGAAVICCVTAAPEFMQTLGKVLAEGEILLLEAPVSGGVQGAAEGKLTLMTSGPPAAYHVCEDILQAIAKKVYRLGGVYGAASKIKLINQLLVSVHIAAAAEAMALGLREGVNPEVLHEVITNSAGNSWAFADRVPRILSGGYMPPHTALDIFVKDLELVLDAARTSHFPLPLTTAAYQMFARASCDGLGGEDDTAVIKTFPGISLPGHRGLQ